MPKRKHSKNRDVDIDRLRSKIKKLERKIRKHRNSESSISSTEQDNIPTPDITPATPILQPEDWPLELSEPEVFEDIQGPTVTEDNSKNSETPQVAPSAATTESQDGNNITNDVTLDLDSDVMAILGDDPSNSVKYGPEIREELATRLSHLATEGLSKESRKDLISKYPIPANCIHIDAPKINPEIKAAVPETAVKRDKGIEAKQKQMASAISILSEVINLQLNSKNKDNELLQKLMDTNRILCDIQHADSTTRRNFILFALKNDMKEHLKNTKIDTYLFGENLAETLKSAKAVNKSGVELKADSSNKAVPKKYKQAAPASKSLNRRAPPQARRPPPGPGPRSHEATAPRAPAHPQPRAHSSKTSAHGHPPPHPRRRY